ncbi:hypothetical protein Cgig2_025232 [Carnegiea gigantea]|uniref:Uncharacterized protein n=1 Tax=Carnegiea gigantea TaxID=171969 RepID=A0A9Q1GR62_9CARY|nr:hypothetical protein Cgig2_025232 [Carnegiea gigantea]
MIENKRLQKAGRPIITPQHDRPIVASHPTCGEHPTPSDVHLVHGPPPIQPSHLRRATHHLVLSGQISSAADMSTSPVVQTCEPELANNIFISLLVTEPPYDTNHDLMAVEETKFRDEQSGGGLRMEGSSSLRNNLASECKDGIAVCRRCNCESVKKVSHLSQNPGRIYFKCLRCNKFLKCVANHGPQERQMIVDIDEVKHGDEVDNEKTIEHNNPLASLSSSKYIVHYVCKATMPIKGLQCYLKAVVADPMQIWHLLDVGLLPGA